MDHRKLRKQHRNGTDKRTKDINVYLEFPPHTIEFATYYHEQFRHEFYY